MYVRYSSNTKLNPVAGFELIWFLLNNPSITSVAELIAHPSWVAGTFLYNHTTTLVASRSEIVRTASTANVAVNRFQDTSGGLNAVTLQFQSYDSSTQKYYVQCLIPVAGQHTLQVGTSASPAFTAGTSSSAGTGSRSALSGTTTWISGSTDQPFDQFFYITDNCFVYSWNGEFASSATGWGISRSTASANGHGPWIAAQYTRHDWFNTAANGLIPVMTTNGYLATYNPVYGLAPRHFTTALNPDALNSEVPFRVLHTMNAAYTASPSLTLTANKNVHMGVGCRSSDGLAAALNASNTVTTASTQTYGAAVTTTAGQRYILPDGSGNGYALLPLWWQYSTHNMAGGSASDKSDIWIYNGDFYAGDEITANGKTYALWPLYGADSNRLALAVPKA